MSDLISRQKAIKAIQEWAVNLNNPKQLSREDTIYILEHLPTVDEYARGYNDAKREIALSGEYERAYERGKADAAWYSHHPQENIYAKLP